MSEACMMPYLRFTEMTVARCDTAVIGCWRLAVRCFYYGARYYTLVAAAHQQLLLDA